MTIKHNIIAYIFSYAFFKNKEKQNIRQHHSSEYKGKK